MSLRLRLIVGLVLINAAVLGLLAAWAGGRVRELTQPIEERGRQLETEVARLVQGRIQPEEVGNLARMLSWPLWTEFEDALIVDTRVLDGAGRPVPVGVFLNPKGNARRRADFPLDEITQAMVRATATQANIPVAGGVALPLFAYDSFGSGRSAWGGLFVRLVPPAEKPDLFLRLLLVGSLATLLAALLFSLMLERSVLRPVLQLAAATSRFGAGGQPELRRTGHAAREVEELAAALERMMREIRGFQRELERRVEEATARALAAERQATRQERLAALGMLAAGLAHEINSPLAGALHSLEVVRKEAAGAKAERYGALAEEALQRIRELVQRLLQMAPQRAIGGQCSLQTVAEDLRAFLAARLARHRFELDLPATGITVRGDRGDWFPLLLNLAQNALDALDDSRPAGGRLALSARTLPDGGAEVCMRDDGDGAPPELLPHLFEPFITSKDPGHGTGLGLALAHAAVRALGGSIEASNAAGGGFEVRIRVPAPDPV